MLLAGDIGGTKTRLALYPTALPPGCADKPVADLTFASADYRSLEAVVSVFMAAVGDRVAVERATFGVAGPVVNGAAHITNLPWTMSEQALAAALNIPVVTLINDLEAIAHGVACLDPGDLATINAGSPVSGGTIAVIAPGTGLGEAYITWDGGARHVHASEGGHADFAPVNAQQIALLSYLMTRFHHVSYERVCSGIGIPNIYGYLRESGYDEPAELAAQLAATADPTRVIVSAATRPNGAVPICVETLDIFVAVLGAEASNFALKVMATGGLYIAGGIPPRIMPFLRDGQLLRAFKHKGRFTDLVGQIPMHVVLNSDVALLGAAAHASSHVPKAARVLE